MYLIHCSQLKLIVYEICILCITHSIHYLLDAFTLLIINLSHHELHALYIIYYTLCVLHTIYIIH